jgi:hypothetical protein
MSLTISNTLPKVVITDNQFDSEQDLGECKDGEMNVDYKIQADYYRRKLAVDFHARKALPVLFPTVARGLIFLVTPDPRVEALVSRAVTNEKIMIDRGDADEAGYIYAFHVRGEHARTIKIGKTTQKPAQRMKQWKRELRKQVDLLFAFPTNYTRLAEQLVHKTLFCEWLSKRVNGNTGHKLVEFFEIVNLMAAKLLIACIMEYVREIGDRMRLMPASAKPGYVRR